VRDRFADSLVACLLAFVGVRGAGTPHQGSPNQWEPGRFDRFPVRPGLKNDREPVPAAPKKSGKTVQFGAVCPVFRPVFWGWQTEPGSVWGTLHRTRRLVSSAVLAPF
jgi:hypothetical protein